MMEVVNGRRARLAASLVAIVLVVAGCAKSTGSAPTAAPSSKASFPITLTDDDGVAVTIGARPTRIVTFAPSITEIVYALGLGDTLVGVSGSYDDYPAQAKTVPHVGGAGEFGVDPNIEKVVALHPDLLLTISGGDQWKARLRSVGVMVFTVNSTDFADTLHDIQTIGEITGTEKVSTAVTDGMAAEAKSIEQKVDAEAPVSCFFEVYFPPLDTVGPGSFIYGLLQQAGCDPVTSSAKSAYPQWSLEKLVTSNPEVYLIGSAPGVSAGSVAKRAGFDALAAVGGGRVFVVNSDLVTRPGPRLVQGLQALATVLHPQAFR